MGELKGWIINISTAVFFITAVEMLLPDNNMKKYAKFVMGLILITVLINPIVMLLNNGSSINTFLDRSIGLIDEPDVSVNNTDYQKVSIEATLQVFQKNLEELCKKRLREKFDKNEFQVNAQVKYNKDREEYEVKEIEVFVNNSNGKVEKVKKIEIRNSSNLTSSSKIQSEMSSDIKKFLSEELNISERIIYVYKSKT